MSLTTSFGNLKNLLSQFPIRSRDRLTLKKQIDFYTDLTTKMGLAELWEAKFIDPATAKLGGVADPTWSKFADNGGGSTGVFAYSCSASAVNELYFTVQFPHNYKEGTDIYPNIHWAASSTGTGDVIWNLEYAWINLNTAPTTSTIISKTAAALGAGGTNKQVVASFSAIAGTAKTMASQLFCRVERDGAAGGDTYGAACWLLGLSFNYQIDKYGSTAQWTK